MDLLNIKPVRLDDEFSDPAYWEEGRLLLIDKPLTWTSFDLVNKCKLALRSGLNIRKIKIGHAGTLDPLATGLMLILTGKFTRLTPMIHEMDKTYEATLFLGATTPCYDAERPVDALYPTGHITPELIRETANRFTGRLVQHPPVFSAVKINGKKAYKSAHRGREVKTRPRFIDVHRLDLEHIDLPYVSFKVTCSAGTYIRSLAHDMGKAMDSGAYLFSLKRTRIGPWSLDEAMDIRAFSEKLNSAPASATLMTQSLMPHGDPGS